MSTALAAPSLSLRAISYIVWRLVPGRGPTKMAEFSHTEAGSGLDMLAAVEETPRRDLRRRYFQHALDELKHARMFREQAIALSQGRGRAAAVLDDAEYIGSHGIRGKESLFSSLSEVEFLAFVWVHEKRGAEQFQVYSDLMDDDPAVRAMFAEIARDERFHIAYSAAELDRYRTAGEGAAVDRAVRSVWWRRYKQGWLRFSHDFGAMMAGLWLSLLWLVLIGPFSLIARLTEKSATGFIPAGPAQPAAARARELG
jgi:hypothetical protein